MTVDTQALGARLKQVREWAQISQHDAAAAIGVSQPTYHRVEQGGRALRGPELVVLADLFGVRAAAIAGVPAVRARATCAARTDGSRAAMNDMKERLYAYLELDAYLTDRGVPRP